MLESPDNGDDEPEAEKNGGEAGEGCDGIHDEELSGATAGSDQSDGKPGGVIGMFPKTRPLDSQGLPGHSAPPQIALVESRIGTGNEC
jgi:hypothetical protein